MSGLEVFAVVGAVAAVVSAYENGGRIVAEIKAKRARRKAPPPTIYLEQSLSKGPPALEEAKNNGIERFGRSFAIGDKIATESLKDILIDLQSSLLEHLYPAAENDNLVDFSMLVDVSDLGRIKAVSALYELHMRMAKRAPITINPSSLPSSQLLNKAPSDYQEQQVENKEHLVSDSSHLVPSSSSYSGDLPTDTQRHHDRHSIIESPKNRKWTSSMSLQKLSPQKVRLFSRRKSSQDHPPSSTPTSDRTTTMLHQQNQHDVPNRSAETESSKHVFGSNPWQDEASASRSQEGGTRSSFSSHATTLTTSAWPSPANGYSGFCEGAYYLQVGLNSDGMRLRNMSTAKTGERWYWGCRNRYCIFEGPACKVGKEFIFDDTVRTINSMKFRWSFLAKSHVAIKKNKAHAYDYRCIFCILKGISAPSLKIRPFLEHIAEHQGQHLEESILRQTLCINDRIAADDEYFDINLPPLEAGTEPARQDLAAEPATEVQIPIGGLDLYDSLDDDPWKRP